MSRMKAASFQLQELSISKTDMRSAHSQPSSSSEFLIALETALLETLLPRYLLAFEAHRSPNPCTSEA